ncbi:MAG: hypothetical protein OXH53_05215 [bacterium]|nr:hypothetical protein [bacterium]
MNYLSALTQMDQINTSAAEAKRITDDLQGKNNNADSIVSRINAREVEAIGHGNEITRLHDTAKEQFGFLADSSLGGAQNDEVKYHRARSKILSRISISLLIVAFAFLGAVLGYGVFDNNLPQVTEWSDLPGLLLSRYGVGGGFVVFAGYASKQLNKQVDHHDVAALEISKQGLYVKSASAVIASLPEGERVAERRTMLANVNEAYKTSLTARDR